MSLKYEPSSEPLQERMAEELPTGMVLRLAARPYSSRAEALSLSLAKTLAVAKLLQTEVLLSSLLEIMCVWVGGA